MKATGIVRRIDDLGRIVIPKEIRKTLKIQEGSPLEIFTDSEGGVIFKKYSPVGEMSGLAEIYAQTLSVVLGRGCVITDTDRVIAAAGLSKKELQDKELSERMRIFISQKKMKLSEEKMQIIQDSEKTADAATVILSSGDPMGAVILVGGGGKPDTAATELVRTAAILLGKQTE